MGQRTLATAFAAWSHHTLQMQTAKQAMRQVAARLTHQQLAAAFYMWHEAAMQKQHAVQSAHKVLLKFQQGCKVPLAVPSVLASMNHMAFWCMVIKFRGFPADAGYFVGVSLPSSEQQHELKLETLSCTLRVCMDRASATDAMMRTDVLLPIEPAHKFQKSAC